VSVLVALDGLAVLVVVALLGLALLFVRRRVITRRGGTFDCSVRLGQGQHGSPRGPEVFALLADAVVVRCLDGEGPGSIELAMGSDTLTGFLAWLESSPPGIPTA
jgi:hypothetical protein